MIYADHAATTMLSPKAKEAMLPWLSEEYGNPSTLYSFGRKPRQAIAAKTAPKFLLFDEPLATMDDIQVMNALDIFKTLAAQGTQIFFTTANDQMVRLFKEAFQGSSLTYKEYYFTKRINGASLIQERHIHDPLPTEELS